MPIKTYVTKMPPDRTVAEVPQLLVKKWATEIMTPFDDDAKPVANSTTLKRRQLQVLRCFFAMRWCKSTQEN